MKHAALAALTTIVFIQHPALAHEHGAERAERHAACVANITQITTDAGRPVNDADAVCKCLGESVMADPALLAEIDAAGGLPSEDQASDALKAVVQPCLDADAG